ncbi:hypothetical protein C6V08_04270 [Burkholderia gladioli]|nr:hypothetical protein C6V08_04270 [Burkholderia gladioli]
MFLSCSECLYTLQGAKCMYKLKNTRESAGSVLGLFDEAGVFDALFEVPAGTGGKVSLCRTKVKLRE